MDRVVLVIFGVLALATPIIGAWPGGAPWWLSAGLTGLGALGTYLARDVPGSAERAREYLAGEIEKARREDPK